MSTTAAAVEVQRRQREKEKARRQSSPAPKKGGSKLGKPGGGRLGKGGPRIEPSPAGGDDGDAELGQGGTSSRDFQTPTGALTSYEDSVVEAKRRRRVAKTMDPKNMDRMQVGCFRCFRTAAPPALLNEFRRPPISRSSASVFPTRALRPCPPSPQRLASWWVIDPRVSKVLGTWDIVCVFALIFVALVTPFEVAFLESPRDAADLYWRFTSVGWLWCTNRIVDLLFTFDLFLQFRLMFQTSDDSVGDPQTPHAPCNLACTPPLEQFGMHRCFL